MIPNLTRRLNSGTWFGFVEVDKEISKPLWKRFEEMCPFFYNKEVLIEAVPQRMLDYLRHTGTEGSKWGHFPPTSCWYMPHCYAGTSSTGQ